jgi:cysteinyl-tRNA synthetase
VPALHCQGWLSSDLVCLHSASRRFCKTKPAAIEKLAACGRDWVILDAAFTEETPWERADLDAIRGGKPGRKVVAYISIGEAEDYRPYWRKEWGAKGKLTTAAPAWLGTENPEWKGNYRVKYWQPEWQRLMLVSIAGAMARGFDSIYLDIVDGFETFEQDGKDFIDDRVNPETKQSASQLLSHADFLETISAIGMEDLFTEGNKLQPTTHTSEVLGHLEKMAGAKKPALVIEYPKAAERQELSK